jgi:hypothetical protein
MAAAKKATAKKATAKKATAKKATAKKATAKKATAKKATAKKATAKKATAKKATAKKATRKATSASSGGGNVVVASKVKEAVKGQEVRMSSEFVEALNQHVNELITRAAGRAKGNGRSTVRPGDL